MVSLSTACNKVVKAVGVARCEMVSLSTAIHSLSTVIHSLSTRIHSPSTFARQWL